MKLNNLLQNPLNRKIDRAKVAEIKRAIKTSGVIKPLVYTEIMTDKGKENMLTDGHHRYIALKEMGYKDAPVVMSDERGIDTAQFQDMKTVKKAITVLRNLSKHLQGQHDQRTHSPTGRSAIAREWERKPKTRRAATRRGAIKGGAIHLGTIAIPALATAAIIRGASALRFGVIGAGVALVIYEAPQLAFRVIEGAQRERKEFEQERRVKKADGQTDKVNRAIKRGDHLLVLYNKQANIGVYLGNDKARLVNGLKFEDVKTSQNNRLKIASGTGVPSADDTDTTRRILRQVKREQEAINQIAQRAKTEKVIKHLQGQHNQQRHDPTKGKGRVEAKPDISEEKPETAIPAKLKTFQGVKDYLSQGTKVILSAEKAGLKVDENRRRTIGLKRILQNNSKELVLQSWHEGENPIERSYIVTPNNPKALKDIISLAFDPNEANQESIIIIRNGAAEARYQDKRPSLHTTVGETREVPSAKGYYSQVGNIRYVFDFKPLRKDVIKDENRVRMASKTLARVSQERLAKLRDLASTLNRMHKEYTTADVTGLELVREDLQGEMAHPHPGHVKKHQMGEHDQLSHGRRSGGAVRSSVNVPNKSAIKAAQRYVANAGLTRLTRHEPVKVDKDRARRIADAYDDMEHDPNNPEVKAAYKAMADEVAEQYKILPVRIQYTEGDPYSNSEDMRRDVRENSRLKIFTGGESHPLLGMKGQDGVTVNDNFRAVHDYFGHAMRGFQFGPSGEENAWIEHSKMFSPLAQRAMTTETRGQNSWYNFSKENERKKPKDRKFAQQKVGILPDEFLPKRARRMTRKGWTTQGRFRLSRKMDMDEGVNTKSPYKNPEGAQLEGGRV